MDRNEIVRRLKKIAEHAVHTAGEPPLVLSLDDGIALHDSADLLKEQEPVKPKPRNPHSGTWWYECGNCDTAISPSDKFCRGCGRVIDWSK